MIGLDTKVVAERCTMIRMDTTRIAKNFGYMARSLKTMEPDEHVPAALAALDHHFDMHDGCGDWCRRKDETPEQRLASKRYYRDATKDKALFVKLQEMMSRFVTKERLTEIAHGMDTNANESFNNTVSWLAPKNKVHCGSRSLNNRMSMAMGITSVGVLEHFKRLLKKLGIPMTPNVLHFLKQKERLQQKRLQEMRSSESKKKRNKPKCDKLAEDTRLARKERHRRAGTHR